MHYCYHFLGFFIILGIARPAKSQEITREDYARAVGYLWENVEHKKAFDLSLTPHWFPSGADGWYVQYDRNGKTFQRIDPALSEIRPLFDHQRLADQLSSILPEPATADSLPMEEITYLDENHLMLQWEDYIYTLNTTTYEITPQPPLKDEELMESVSPDSQWVAYPEDYNLFIRSAKTGEKYALSDDGTQNYEYGSYYGWYDLMEGENGERPAHFSVNWSPDGRYLQTSVCDLRYADKMFLLDWSIDSLYRPKLLSYYRGSPGDTTMVYMLPKFYRAATQEAIELNLPRNTYVNPVNVRWSSQPDVAYADYLERGFQCMRILRCNLAEQRVDTLLSETTATRIDNFEYWLMEEQNKLLFVSERSGWRQLYSLDLDTKEINPMTNGKYYVNDVAHLDEEAGVIYFVASGRESDQNPYAQTLYRVGLDGKEPTLLTPEKAHHQVSFSSDGRYFTDAMSLVDQPTRSVLRDASSGNIVLTLAEADVTELVDEGWTPPQVFEVIGRDDSTKIYGALWKPTHFDSTESYPIIDHSYTGPHTQMFPTSFSSALNRSNQALAELGFVVMMVDGLGTAGRSKAFHDVSYKHMGLNLLDHVLTIRQLGQQYAWIDTTRVGIFGHSAGGYDAGHALLQYPEMYKVGVASSADHDFRMEKAWWPEMYMGWPVDSTYQLQSNITMADRLQGKLLIVHGGIDNNVNPSATFKLAEALVKADKEFDMLILPSQQHGYQDQPAKYFVKKRWNYFVKHLKGVEPIWDFDWNP